VSLGGGSCSGLCACCVNNVTGDESGGLERRHSRPTEMLSGVV